MKKAWIFPAELYLQHAGKYQRWEEQSKNSPRLSTFLPIAFSPCQHREPSSMVCYWPSDFCKTAGRNDGGGGGNSSFRCQLQPYSSLWIPNLFLKVNLTYLINNVQLSNVASVSKRDGNIPDMKPFISDSVMQPQTTPVSIKYCYPDTQTEGASTSGSTAAMLFPCCICSGSQKGAQSLPNCHYRPLDKWKFTF